MIATPVEFRRLGPARSLDYGKPVRLEAETIDFEDHLN